jgi:hypothetical protein
MCVDHRVAADEKSPIIFARRQAEERRIDRDGFECLLFALISVAGGNRAIDRNLGKVGLDLPAFYSPRAVNQLLDKPAFRECAEVLDGRCLTRETEVFGDLTGGGRLPGVR